MMAEGMDFCSADRQSPFQDPLTPLSSNQNGQEQSPDYCMCSIIYQHEKIIENYPMELSYHLMYLRHTTVQSASGAKEEIEHLVTIAQQKIRHHEEQARLLETSTPSTQLGIRDGATPVAPHCTPGRDLNSLTITAPEHLTYFSTSYNTNSILDIAITKNFNSSIVNSINDLSSDHNPVIFSFDNNYVVPSHRSLTTTTRQNFTITYRLEFPWKS
ncbi:hypothetical protein CEXT_640531 [Caerostris extrusa]|uniref:Uncharacterized protein n=1 Tax=Caerostris extrusa TaxID=172846 RepID=A0AAV4X0N1_CAEEX|nr:hypothetical protein CEXT_640531 [Caerostris extrusa]